VIKNRKSFHLVRVFSRQWRQLTFGYTVPMIADHEISSPTYTTMDDEVSTCIILVLKEVKFLEFLALQRNVFMYVLPYRLSTAMNFILT
jgi:hypothetical protein